MIAPLRWEDGVLLILDQTLLPDEETWIRCERPEQVADAIAGSPYAARRRSAWPPPTAWRWPTRSASTTAAELLAAARPTAVNLRWAVDQVAAGGPAGALCDAARAIEERERDATRRIAEHGAALFGDGERVLTHCNTGALATAGSGTALGVIEAAWRAAASPGLGRRDPSAQPGRAIDGLGTRAARASRSAW